MKPSFLILGLLFFCVGNVYSQKADSVKHYFIITAGTVINAYYQDKPLNVETVDEFNTYIAANAKTMKESWVVVTGKPNEGTFNDVLKTLSHYRFKHVTKNIIAN